MQAIGADADLGAEAELEAVGEARRGVDEHRGRVDLGREAARRRVVGGDDRVGETRAVAADERRSRRRSSRRPSRRESDRGTRCPNRRRSRASRPARWRRVSASPRISTPAAARRPAIAGRKRAATSRWTSRFSIALQTPGRCALAFMQIRSASRQVGGAVDVEMADAAEVLDHRDARALGDRADQLLAAARDDDVDVVGSGGAGRGPPRGRWCGRARSRRAAALVAASLRTSAIRQLVRNASRPPRRTTAFPDLRQSAGGVGGDVRPRLVDDADRRRAAPAPARSRGRSAASSG